MDPLFTGDFAPHPQIAEFIETAGGYLVGNKDVKELVFHVPLEGGGVDELKHPGMEFSPTTNAERVCLLTFVDQMLHAVLDEQCRSFSAVKVTLNVYLAYKQSDTECNERAVEALEQKRGCIIIAEDSDVEAFAAAIHASPATLLLLSPFKRTTGEPVACRLWTPDFAELTKNLSVDGDIFPFVCSCAGSDYFFGLVGVGPAAAVELWKQLSGWIGRKPNLSSRQGVTQALTWLVSSKSGLSSRVKNCIRDAGDMTDLAETLAIATTALVNGGEEEGTYTSCNINESIAEEMKQGQIMLNGDALPMKVKECIDMVTKHTDEVANRGQLENFFLAQVHLDVPLLPEGVVLQVKTHGQTRNPREKKARFSIVFKQPLSLGIDLLQHSAYHLMRVYDSSDNCP